MATKSIFWARVLRATDGDGLKISHAGQTITCRLWGIDAPEHDQPWGAEAHDALSDACAGHTLRLEAHSFCYYGRLLVVPFIAGAYSAQEMLVGRGLAWLLPYRLCTPADWRDLEAQARSDRIGLWLDPNPVPPWLWRRARAFTRPRGRRRSATSGVVRRCDNTTPG